MDPYKNHRQLILPLIGGLIMAGAGIGQMIEGHQRRKKAKDEAEAAKIEYDKSKGMFKSLDTSNPYLNMENVYEDTTVNQREAEFMKQQQMQQQANILQQTRGAAGGSGIAGLAQVMANQGALDAQRASVSIGQQERENLLMERGEAGRLQGLEREGEVYSRQAELGKVTGLLGMSRSEMMAAKAEEQLGSQQFWGGLSGMGKGISGMGGSSAFTKRGQVEGTDADKRDEVESTADSGLYDDENMLYMPDDNTSGGRKTHWGCLLYTSDAADDLTRVWKQKRPL